MAALFLRTVDSRPPSFFSSHVKSLYFHHDIDLFWITKILAVCSGIWSLTCNCWPIPSLSTCRELNFPTLLTSLYLKRFSGRLKSLLALENVQPNFRQPFFASLTHLRVYDNWESWSAWSWDGLDSITHLCLSFRRRWWNKALVNEAIGRVLLQCRKLRVCTMQASSDTIEGVRMLWRDYNDPRLVTILFSDCSDFYDRVEEVVKRQRAEM